ncbi:MAG: D-cysteine desulfhydrase family protein [Chloroflexi bacterium]|nr:D-cysteine desulfhydrase family protein [Chloroflexota bacterium]
MLTARLARVRIAHLPTPLEPLPRLSAQSGGPELWIKRDDQTGLASGGNKARKLEFLVADALQRKADTLITGGAAQSNHARQTAAAAAKFGLGCTLVLRGEQPAEAQGNLLLDKLLGADIVWSADRPIDLVMGQTTDDLKARGKRPYLIPYGGSNAIGASGYVDAMEELMQQCTQRDVVFDWIVLPSSSSGTQAGLVVGARALGFQGHILGISIDLPARPLQAQLAELGTATANLLGLSFECTAEDFQVDDHYIGEGYGVLSDLERSGMATLARTEGIVADPVYTGRALGGLLDAISKGAFRSDERVLFWHTGGVGGLFGYGESILG